MLIKQVAVKNILTKSKLPDADYVINPYIGCNHHCVYCYAEFMSRFTGHTGEKWGDFMDVKEGYKILSTEKMSGQTILLGSATDPYNPLENKYEKTRNILLQLENGKADIEILTKSPLVLRDIDILSRMKHIRVGISLSTTDTVFARLTEKSAASPDKRIDAMRQLHLAKIPVYAFVSPLFPFLSDYKAIVSAVEEYADEICFENLNLRGNYKQAVLDLIAKHYPEVFANFVAVYNSKQNFNRYWQAKQEEIETFMRKRKTPYKMYFFHDKIKKA
ncbi:MAG: radical SAM protein [Planctomycetaceae bacterium]|jgi:DNA repair photolyase|nr:radical SAM protein [Planctomycetaceae bacterium]